MDTTPEYSLPFPEAGDLVADYPAVAQDFAELLESLLIGEAWHEIGAGGEPAFLNGAANHGSGYDTAGFYKDALGLVHLKGTVNKGSTNHIFQLPVGYRPSGNRGYASTQNTGGVAEVVIGGVADGYCYITIGATRIELDGIIFRAA